MHSKSRFPRVFFFTTSIVRGASNAVSLYWIASLCPQIVVTGCCHVVFWPRDLNRIFRGKIAQNFSARKIANFYPRHLKLWNRIFQKVNFILCKNKFGFLRTLRECPLLLDVRSGSGLENVVKQWLLYYEMQVVHEYSL